MAGGGGMSNQISQWAGGGATTTLGAIQTAIGLYNQSKTHRPEYKIPDEIGQGLDLAKQRALQGLPEAQKQEYLANLQRAQAYSLGQSSSRKGGLQGIAALNENQNTGYANLLAQDSSARMNNQKDIYGQLQNVSDYKGQEFQFNQLNPYYEKTAQNQAMIGAGMQNISQGLQSSNSGGDYGKSSQANTQKSVVENNSSVNPYSNNSGNTYQNPNLFKQQGNNYGSNVGSWNNPDTSNMFVQNQANPYKI